MRDTFFYNVVAQNGLTKVDFEVREVHFYQVGNRGNTMMKLQIGHHALYI